MKKPQLWIIWGNWGPYHHARFAAFRAAASRAGLDARGVEIVPRSDVYGWRPAGGTDSVWQIPVNTREMEFRPFRLARMLAPLLRRERPAVVFVPSYWHWSLECNLLARATGSRVVMMNESHAGTEQATGIKRWIKRQIVRRFHAALVGGVPHRRHFATLGIPADRIFTGYDAVDNEHFALEAARIRGSATANRAHWGLPPRYFLSLGRLVEKKNISTLIEAYRIRCANPDGVADEALVIVGSGPLDTNLRRRCRDAGLEVIDRAGRPPFPPLADARGPRVFFYGFRQINEIPVFYAFAEAFVLPSTREEWGLVVNEAMASGLPVIVSRAAGCAEDLVRDGENGWTFDPGSPGELAACLARLDGDQAIREKFGKRSTEIVSNFGCDTFANGALAATRASSPGLFNE